MAYKLKVLLTSCAGLVVIFLIIGTNYRDQVKSQVNYWQRPVIGVWTPDPPHSHFAEGSGVQTSPVTGPTTNYSISLLSKDNSAANHFFIRQPFSFPVPMRTRPVEELLQFEWIKSLQEFLVTVESGPVSLVVSDDSYKEVLLNWLISATVKMDVPLSNILVLSLSAALCDLLQDKDIPCVSVPPESVLRPGVKFHNSRREQPKIVRLTVIRLINHWGFDVAMYDSDAIILKNPEPLYEQWNGSDIIGSSSAGFPPILLKRWGTAVCTGVVLLRSTPGTEAFWEVMSKVRLLPAVLSAKEGFHDQWLFNYALEEMKVKWHSDPRASNETKEWQGICKGGLRVSILPSGMVCRVTCSIEHMSSYYIWHKYNKNLNEGIKYNEKGRIQNAKDGKIWYLRSDWEQKIIYQNESRTGKKQQWLFSLVET